MMPPDTNQRLLCAESSEPEFSEDEVTKPLPKVTVLRFVKENIPSGFSFEKQVGELMVQCGTEFVLMISSVGYEFAEKEGMTTIAPRHIVAALKDLGYEEYVEEIEEVIEQLKADKKQKKLDKQRKMSLGQSGMSEEELLRYQTELFGAARAKLTLKEGSGNKPM